MGDGRDQYSVREADTMNVQASAPTIPQPIQVYKLQEIADALQVSRQTLYTYIKQGKLRATKNGRDYRITAAALREFLGEPTAR